MPFATARANAGDTAVRTPAQRLLSLPLSGAVTHSSQQRFGPITLVKQAREGPTPGSVRTLPASLRRGNIAMLPKSVLHKRNGHRHLPPSGAPSTGQILGLVHRDPDRASELSPDLIRFAAII